MPANSEIDCLIAPEFRAPWELDQGTPRKIGVVQNFDDIDFKQLFVDPSQGSLEDERPGSRVMVSKCVESPEPRVTDFGEHAQVLEPFITDALSVEDNRASHSPLLYATFLAELVQAGAASFYRDDWHQEGTADIRFINYSFTTVLPTRIRDRNGEIINNLPGQIWCRDGSVEHAAPKLKKPSLAARLIVWLDFRYN